MLLATSEACSRAKPTLSEFCQGAMLASKEPWCSKLFGSLGRSHCSLELSSLSLPCRRSCGCAHHRSLKKEKGVLGSAEGRGDDSCVLGFIGLFTDYELRPAGVPSPSEAGAEEGGRRERAGSTRPWALTSAWVGSG
jgi:hypothetical protein